MTDFDAGELKQWQHDLDEVLLQAPKETRAVVQRGALNIKRDAQGRVQGLAHAPAYPYAISYDTKETPAVFTAEIGPDKTKRQGALGNLIEFGSENNPPRPHMIPSGEAERPRFEKAMEDLAARILEQR
ncbi:hypothetical protein ACWER9_06485 [Micromonospora sp. NPDC003944]